MPVTRLRTRGAKRDEGRLVELHAMVADAGAPEDVSRRILTMIERELSSRSGWRFVMVDPQAFHGVVRHLTEGKEKGSKRPMVAVRVWSALFQYLPPDGNEVRAGREEIAAAAGCTPNDVSHVMRELQAIGAISSRRRGRLVTYEVNPLVGTHLTGTFRDKAQAEAPRLRLIEPA